MHKDIIIVGAGFSGTMLAAHLVRHPIKGRHVHLIADDKSAPGRGVAYSTPMVEHPLNVRAQQMSAWAEDPEHFVRWLTKELAPPATDKKTDDPVVYDDLFAPRRLYGQYLEDILSETLRASRADSGVALSIYAERAESLKRGDSGLEVTLSSGRTLSGTVVLCNGHLPPRWPKALRPLGENLKNSSALVENPWDWNRVGVLHEASSVGIVGTGLSMVDTLLTLHKRGYAGPIFAFSRHGYLPMRHRLQLARRTLSPRERPTTARELVAVIADEIRLAKESGDDWRQVIDALRPVTLGMWRALSRSEQGRIWRHAKALWDAHRHRIAPEVADVVDTLRTRGQLKIFAGQAMRARSTALGLEVTLQPRQGGALHVETFGRLINCTGGALSWVSSQDPWLRSLFASGLATAGPFGLGPQTNEQGALIGEDGQAQKDLFVMGPALTPQDFESVAVPELRKQAAHLAHLLSSPNP